MQPAEGAQHVQPRPQPQVEGVAEDDLRAHLFERARRDALDRAVGADRHEDRRLDDAVVEREAAAAGIAGRGCPSVLRYSLTIWESVFGEQLHSQHLRKQLNWVET